MQKDDFDKLHNIAAHVPAREDLPPDTFGEILAQLRSMDLPKPGFLYIEIISAFGPLYQLVGDFQLSSESKIKLSDPARLWLNDPPWPQNAYIGKITVYYVIGINPIYEALAEISGIHDLAKEGETRTDITFNLFWQEVK